MDKLFNYEIYGVTFPFKQGGHAFSLKKNWQCLLATIRGYLLN